MGYGFQGGRWMKQFPVKKTENGVIKTLVERDIRLLLDLFQYESLKVQQIRELYFPDTKRYVYRRLELLKKDGYVKSRPMVVKGKKVAASYYVTDKAIRLLEELRLIEKRRRSWANKPVGGRLPYVLNRNEMVTKLQPYGWTFINSRDFKTQNNLNRGALLTGALIREDGKEYVLYILENQIREGTLQKVIAETKTLGDRNILLLCKGADIYERVQNETLNAKEICILPFHIAIPILQWLRSKDILVRELQRFGEVTIEHNRFHFGDVMVQGELEKYYVANCLMGDKMTLHYLKRYSYDVYQRNGVKVLLLHWAVNQFQFPFDQYPHVQSVPFYLEDLPTYQ